MIPNVRTTCCLLSVLLISPLQPLAGDAEPLWRQMLTEVKTRQADPVRISLRADELLQSDDCDSIQVGTFLKVQAAVIQGAEAIPLDTVRCAWTASPIWYVAALQAFAADDMDAAELLLKRALVFAREESIYRECEALQVLGVICMNRGNYKEAIRYFSESFEHTPTEIPPIYLSNLAFATFVVGDCVQAIRWSDIAWERLTELEKDPAIPVEIFLNEYNLVALNRLKAAMGLREWDLARESFDKISFHRPFEGWESAAAATLIQYTQSTNDRALFLSLRGPLQQLLEGLDPEEVGKTLGANAALFENPALPEEEVATLWQSLQTVPVELRGGFEGHCFVVENESIVSPVTDLTRPLVLGTGALVLAAVAGGVWGVGIRRKRLVLSELFSIPDDALRAFVDQSLDRPPHIRYTPMRMARARLAYFLLLQRQVHMSLDHLAQWQDWSEIEREVALATARGEQTKLLATRLDLSVSKVYRIRMNLRESLALTEEASLYEWLKNHAR